MLLVISPAKTLDYETKPKTKTFSMPDFLPDSQQLINRARKYSVLDIMELMAVSKKIAELNFERFEAWHTPFTQDNAKQAVLAFKGDVYTGLDAETFTASDFSFAQKHLRILSGLYGLLRPLDLMQAYRLEMGRKIDTDRGKNLYEFWGSIITDGLNQQLKKLKSDTLVNLASNEYFKSVKPKQLHGKIITPEFKDYKNGEYKMMGVYAKKARGQLSRYVIQNKIIEPEAMKDFNIDGYKFNKKMSSDLKWVFARKQKP
ncbi:MAG: peroxide stress protein YaaA [Gammaproteobacteria bacterium]|nr:peroxide stress protein YaaA [Gammaproteobacteria bacterium]